MDESATLGAIPDGFVGQRMVVLPRAAVRAALTRPVTDRLLVTDAGVFPHAARHGRERPKGAAEHILVVCTDGEGTVGLDGGTHQLRKGDAAVIPAFAPHSYAASARDPWTLWWFHFVGTAAGDLVRTARIAAAGPVSHLRSGAPIASLVSQAIDGLDANTTGGLVAASGAAFHALTLIIATGRRSAGPSLSPVERALQHLRDTTPQRTSVEGLAAMVGLSPSQFGSLFRAQVGMPPLRYQRELRMARARELLDSTTLPVTSIAAECGYEDPLYFSRQFTATHGMSPKAYRSRDL